MGFIDGTVVNIAVPVIQASLSADITSMQWVVNGYLLMLGALILVGGGLGDRLGRRRIFIVGIVLFAVASLLCAVAPDIRLLIAARILQGIGAALFVPQSLAIISANFPREVRGRAIGTWAAASSITTAFGPPLGGFLVEYLSWRAAFWINLPLAAITLWLTWRHVPESRDPDARGKLDWQGGLVGTLAFGALSYGLTELSEESASRAVTATAIAAGLVGIAFYVLVERRSPQPLTPPSLFRDRVFSAVNVATVFLYGALAAALFLLPFDLLARRGLSPGEAGAIMLPFGLIIGVLSRYTGGLSDKFGPRLFLTIGPIVVGLGCLGLAFGINDLWLGVMVPIVLIAGGMAIVVSPLTTAVMNAAPEGKSGAASGISNAASRLAGVLAVAILGAVASLVFSRGAPVDARFGVIPAQGDAARAQIEAAFLSGYAAAMILAAAWCFVAAAVSYFALPPSPAGKKQTSG
jgi:EmrB/QacA subfamily drug resistance transporter